MASTFSDLKFELIGTGDQSGTWGITTNDNIGVAIEEAITGSADVTFASADVTVTLTDTVAAQTARNLRLNLTGTTGGARNLILGSGCQIEKLYLINNGTADTITVKNTTGTGIAVPAGKSMFVYNDATNVVDATTHLSSLTLGTDLAVADGGTGLSSGTSGGIPYFSSTTAMSSSAALAANAIVIGGGAGVAPSTTTTGTGVVTAIGNNTNSANGLPVLNGSGNLGVAQGGTGAGTLTLNNVILGNGTSAVQFVAPGTTGNILTSNGTTWTSAVPAPGGIEYVVKTTNYTTQDKEGVLADTSGGSFTVTLPATPSTGAQVVVADPTGDWGANNLTIGRNGSTIAGVAQDLICDISGASVQLVYDGTTWAVYAQVGGNGGTVVTLSANNALTGANTFYNATGQTFAPATTNDGIIIQGRAGGSSTYRVTFATATLSANRTLTFPDATDTAAVLGTAQTFTALQTFSGSTSVAATKLTNAKEVATISATAATGTINYDVTTQSVLYYTSNASANWTVNFRGSSGTSLDALMSTGESMTVAFLVTQGSTAYYNSAVQVDGSSVTPKYQGGTAWSAGNASSIDAYVYTIVKTGSAAFTVFASQTRFA